MNKEKVWRTLQLPEGMGKVSSFGDSMELAEFLDYVAVGAFIDSDGSGHWATDTQMLGRVFVRPSLISSGKQVPPAWATHVIWFNK